MSHLSKRSPRFCKVVNPSNLGNSRQNRGGESRWGPVRRLPRAAARLLTTRVITIMLMQPWNQMQPYLCKLPPRAGSACLNKFTGS